MASQRIPLEVLFGDPKMSAPKLSPDGSKVAFIAPNEGVLSVWVSDLGGDARALTKEADSPAAAVRWSVSGSHVLYKRDDRGDENWHILAVGLDGGPPVDLTPFGTVYSQVVGSSGDPDRIAVEINADDPRLHDVYLIDVESGEARKFETNPGSVVAMQPDSPAWFLDSAMNVVGATRVTGESAYELMIRPGGQGDWKVVHTFQFEDSRSSKPLRLGPDGKSFFAISSVGAKAGRLVRIDCVSGDVEVVSEDPGYDVDQVLFDKAGDPIAVAYNRDRLTWQGITPEGGELIGRFERIHSGDFWVESRGRDDRLWLLTFSSDVDPAQYYVFDAETGDSRFLGECVPEIHAYEGAVVRPVSFAARDGVTLNGYLTLPRDAAAQSFPMVLMPHGGPWARDSWSFNPRVQWLADRGYACLQVNFRGSTGYGKEFLNAGNKQWGDAMHDDLIDAVDWSIRSGYADPQRIAVLGGSYGGYATLCCGAFTPGVFKCAVEMFGWSNLIDAMESLPDYWIPRAEQWFRRVGDPVSEREMLWDRSPLSRIDSWQIPILVAHGATDARVKKKASDDFVAELRRIGVEHEYIVFEDEGHGFLKQRNRVAFYAAAERFLARHLAGG